MRISSFKNFLQLNESGYGITHIEDLPVETFIRLLDNISDLHAVQKLDGANLLMGIDREGKLYTSREQKGGKRFYKLSDFPHHSAYDGFKTAHAVLEKVADTVKKIIPSGVAINCEILFGVQPNTVIYGKDNLNYIAFLETILGDDPSKDIDDELPKKLYDKLKGQRISVQTKLSDTADGASIVKAPRTTDWGFSKSDDVDGGQLKDDEVEKLLKELNSFLKKSNKAAQSFGLDLTNFEVIKHKSPKLKEEKDKLEEVIMSKYKLPIKKKMLKSVANLKPSLRGQDPTAQGGYDGIEGIILTDRDTREQFKVVDKEEFTAVNKFNYEVRNKLSGRITTADDDADLMAKGGMIGVAKIRCTRLFGIPGIEAPSQAKKTLAKFKGESEADTFASIAKNLKSLKFEAIKRKMGAIITSTIHDLESELDAFKSNVADKSLKLSNGKKIKYTQEIRRRTLMSFAETLKSASELLSGIRASKDMESLLKVFFEDTVKTIQSQEIE